MRLPEATQPPHKACNDNRSNKKGGERSEVLRIRYLESENRRYEKEVEAEDGGDRENDRPYEAVRQRQQYDDNQIDAGGCRGTQTETETRPGRERQGCGARDQQRHQGSESTDLGSLHARNKWFERRSQPTSSRQQRATRARFFDNGHHCQHGRIVHTFRADTMKAVSPLGEDLGYIATVK